MDAPRYTAKEIEDGLYSGMDPDAELVAALYYDRLAAENAELKRRLDAVVKSLVKDSSLKPTQDSSLYRRGIWNVYTNLHARAVAIAEGRNNG